MSTTSYSDAMGSVLERLQGVGYEFTPSHVNHAPMAAEAMAWLGYTDVLPRPTAVPTASNSSTSVGIRNCESVAVAPDDRRRDSQHRRAQVARGSREVRLAAFLSPSRPFRTASHCFGSRPAHGGSRDQGSTQPGSIIRRTGGTGHGWRDIMVSPGS